MSHHHFHAVVWIDHLEARVFHIGAGEVDRMVLRPDNPTRHIHHKTHVIGSGHAAPDEKFLHAVVEAVADAGAILIAGPGAAKTELIKHIHAHDPKLIKAIAGVETVDHPSDGALVAHARKYFATADRMTKQTG